MLESWALQIGVFKYRSRKKEVKKEEGNICDQATKSIVREETGTFHMEKGTKAL